MNCEVRFEDYLFDLTSSNYLLTGPPLRLSTSCHPYYPSVHYWVCELLDIEIESHSRARLIKACTFYSNRVALSNRLKDDTPVLLPRTHIRSTLRIGVVIYHI